MTDRTPKGPNIAPIPGQTGKLHGSVNPKRPPDTTRPGRSHDGRTKGAEFSRPGGGR